MKIKTRLSVWFVLLSLAILVIFSLGTYISMRHLLFQTLEKERDLIAKTVALNYNPAIGRFNTVPFHISGQMKEIYLVVHDGSGQVIYRSGLAKEMANSIPLITDQVEKRVTIEMGARQFPFLDSVDKIELSFRAVSRQILHNQRSVGWVTIAHPVSDLEQSLQSLLHVLLAGIVLAGVVLGVGSYFWTHQALRPVAAITQKAKQISSRNLNERIEIENSEDELGQLSLVLNDLLDRLQKSFDSQQQFMADAAHELRTPLAILRAHWEDELQNPELKQETREKLAMDVETISRLNRLINNLMLLSQTEEAQSDFVSEPVRLDEVVQAIVADAGVLAEMKAQRLTFSSDGQATVLGDRGYLYQLFFNLIDNAVKYTPEGGSVRVSLSRAAEGAVVKVHDDGVGIEKEELSRIFDRFYRVHKDRSRKTGGSGLGLAICKLIVEKHQGKIAVTSVVGEGSTFTVSLPLAPAPQTA